MNRDDISFNHEQRLYVRKEQHGKETYYSCLGYDVVEKKIAGLCAWLNEPDEPADPGTLERYGFYHFLMLLAKQRYEETGEKCLIELTPELIGLEGTRVEVVDCYGETRRFIIGKSGGWMPCHLEIARRDSSGGSAVYGAPFKVIYAIGKNGKKYQVRPYPMPHGQKQPYERE